MYKATVKRFIFTYSRRNKCLFQHCSSAKLHDSFSVMLLRQFDKRLSSLIICLTIDIPDSYESTHSLYFRLLTLIFKRHAS